MITAAVGCFWINHDVPISPLSLHLISLLSIRPLPANNKSIAQDHDDRRRMHSYRQMGITTKSPSLLYSFIIRYIVLPYPYNITTPESTPVLVRESASIEREKKKRKRKFVHACRA
jgi:hypothetical protein